jgi:cytosine/uracil/thiamine/allantoin permease
MPFETHPLFISVCLFFLALIFIFGVKNLKNPNSIWALIIGIALVALGAWALSGSNIMHHFLDTLHDKKHISEAQFNEGKQSAELWMAILPAVVAAMGANLITSWSLSRN